MVADHHSSEQNLIKLLKAGHEPAFNELYHLHSKMLFSNILHLVKDREIAKELLQDLYLKIWEYREKLNEEKSFKSFLFAIAKNMVYDYFRKVSLDRKMTAHLIGLASESYIQSDALELQDISAGIMAAIDQLPPQSKKVYQLSKLEGKSHEEISAELNISPSTVNNHMVKANKMVKAFLLNNTDLAIVLIAYSIIHSK